MKLSDGSKGIGCRVALIIIVIAIIAVGVNLGVWAAIDAGML